MPRPAAGEWTGAPLSRAGGALRNQIAGLGRPTLFVMEGGYAVEEIGINAVNVLTGFEEAASFRDFIAGFSCLPSRPSW